MSEEQKYELGLDASADSQLVLDAGSGQPAADNTSLFSILERRQQQFLVVVAYGVCLLLGCYLSIVAFHYEFQAQMAGKVFDMHDWMVTLILVCLGLPGAACLRQLFNRRSCPTCGPKHEGPA